MTANSSNLTLFLISSIRGFILVFCRFLYLNSAVLIQDCGEYTSPQFTKFAP